jgi:hypothetical protein
MDRVLICLRAFSFAPGIREVGSDNRPMSEANVSFTQSPIRTYEATLQEIIQKISGFTKPKVIIQIKIIQKDEVCLSACAFPATFSTTVACSSCCSHCSHPATANGMLTFMLGHARPSPH